MTASTPSVHKAARSWHSRVESFIASALFFWIIIGLFIVEAAWIAVSARYPQAFDEQFHFGIIKFYSQHLNPFASTQPVTADQFGAITRDPSYLYQYALALVFRLLSSVTSNTTTQVICLRFLNLGLFVGGLIVFRCVLRRLRVSAALTNVTLACFAFTPVMVLLASQINYDNLVFVLSGLFLLLTTRLIEYIREQHRISWDQVVYLCMFGLLASLVKYAFLPIFIATLLVLIMVVWRRARGSWLKSFMLWLHTPQSWLLMVGLIICLGLFWQRYGINMVQYHTPLPECNQVLTIERCKAYAPWARNYMFESWDITLHAQNLLTYPAVWVYHNMGELVFTISSNFNQTGTVDYHAGVQLIAIEVLSWGVFAVGLLLLIVKGHWLIKQQPFSSILFIAIFYVAILMAQNFSDYVHLGLPVAIHGRYLVPVLPVLYAAVGLLVSRTIFVRRHTKIQPNGYKAILGVVAMGILLVEGGGFVTYILRSDPSWFWPQNSHVQRVNHTIQRALKPVIIDTER